MTVTAESLASVSTACHPPATRDPCGWTCADWTTLIAASGSSALRALAPGVESTGEEMQLLSARAADVYWLRYEIEVRMPQRYRWSLPREARGTTHTTVGLP